MTNSLSLLAAALALAGCAGAATTAATADGPRTVTVEHDARLPADEVAARAMQRCIQAGKANAAFEAIVDKPYSAGTQLSTYRCTP